MGMRLKRLAPIIMLVTATALRAQESEPPRCPEPLPVFTEKWSGPPLMKAILEDNADQSSRLIKRGVRLDEKDNLGNTPLVAALTPTRRLEPTGVVSIEKLHGMVLAQNAAQMKIVPLLLAHGANPNTAGRKGLTPLMQLATWGYGKDNDKKLVLLLLNHGANPNLRDDFGWTALMYAVSSSKPDLVRLLLQHGADTSTKDCEGKTALSVAQIKKNGSIVGILQGKTH